MRVARAHRRPDGLGPRHHRRHREDEQGDHGAADEQEENLFEAHAPRVLLLGRHEEAHRRPGDDLEAPAIEQVNDDGHRDRGRAGAQRRCPEVEEEGEKHYEISGAGSQNHRE